MRTRASLGEARTLGFYATMFEHEEPQTLGIKRMKQQKVVIGFSVLTALILASCGGGSGSGSTPAAADNNPSQPTVAINQPTVVPSVNTPPNAPTPTTLSGVVAVGAALSGATIVIKDVDATTPDVTVIADAEGSFNADVSTLKTPLVLNASAILNGEQITLVSVIAAVNEKTNNISNITPLTNAIASLIAPSGDISSLNISTALATAATSANINAATSLVVSTLKTDPAIAAVLGSNFQPSTTIFKADGTGIDAVLCCISWKLSRQVAESQLQTSLRQLMLATTQRNLKPGYC
jgi:hypothetical protein